MKKLVILLLCYVFSIANAEEKLTGYTYACPKCEYEAEKSDKCPKHKIDLWKSEVIYQCDKCGKEYEKPGKCHDKELKRAIIIFSSDFSDKEELKNKWQIESGEWKISEGKLHHEADDEVDAMIWIKNLELFGDWEISADFYRVTEEFIGGFAYLAEEIFSDRRGQQTYLTDFLFLEGHEHNNKGRWADGQGKSQLTENNIELPGIGNKLNVKIIKKGETYNIFFGNDAELEVEDDTYTNGAVGIFCYNHNYKKNNSPLEHAIDNVKIKRFTK